MPQRELFVARMRLWVWITPLEVFTMSEEKKNEQLSDDQLKDVAGGAGNVHKQRLDQLDTGSTSKSGGKVQDLRNERLDGGSTSK